MRLLLIKPILLAFVLVTALACDQAENTDNSLNSPAVQAEPAERTDGLKVAFVYGDTINVKYNFLIDAQEELEKERDLIDDRLRRKLSRAEARARELQEQAPTMTQIQMQEAQLELQNLDIEMQQFQESLSADFRKRETELQLEYIAIVDSFLEAYNADGKYDIIMNFQRGGNLLWVDRSFDITDEVLEGLNKAYDERLAAEKAASAKK